MRTINKINAGWAFSKEAKSVPAAYPAEWTQLDLPYTWNGKDGQDGGNDYFRGKCLYIKEFSLSSLPESEEYYLEVLAANSSADLYLNGKKLFHHDGGYSKWRVPLSCALQAENELAIVVDNSPNQEVYPQTADFTFYGGLYRNVNIICVNESHFDLEYYGGSGIAVTPEIVGDDAKINIKTYIIDTKM
ncbi:MAG: glycoside hydrolase family 2 protein, partial [Clostridia bacterium]|nr:glycoside hydrolase family 2 protein [Clostridia bacterium]